MTIGKLLETAVANVDTTENYDGRNNATEAVIRQVNLLIQDLIADTKWETCFVSNPYGKDDPYIVFIAHNTNRYITFKVKCKVVDKKKSWYGNSTYYLPVAAFTTNENYMDKDFVECANELYDNCPQIKANIQKENEIATIKEQYKELTDNYTNIVNTFNALPIEIRKALQTNDLPFINYW